jgi:hypothetical protein
MSLQVFDARPDAPEGYKVDVSRGARIERVSSEWFSRPDDERFLSLSDLQASARARAEHSRTRVVESVLFEEGKKPEIVFDFVQEITAVARDKAHQDARLEIEGRAKKLLDAGS